VEDFDRNRALSGVCRIKRELRSGKIVEHVAPRDDLGLLLHLGWHAAWA
jgi:hypothetical protein